VLLSKKQWIDHPTESDVRFEVRGLSWVELDEARSLASASQREVIKDLGADFLAALGSSDNDESDRALAKLEEQRYHPSQFDTGCLLTAGVVSWTVSDGDGDIVPLNDDTLGQLDEATAMFLVEQIIEITRPASGRSTAASVSLS
jgi:hypothetical protein